MAKTQSEAVRIRLSGKLTLQGIEGTYATICAALGGNKVVEVDCSDANSFDLSFVQLLLSARRTAGERVRLAMPLPAALQDVLQRGGFLAQGCMDLAFWQAQAVVS